MYVSILRPPSYSPHLFEPDTSRRTTCAGFAFFAGSRTTWNGQRSLRLSSRGVVPARTLSPQSWNHVPTLKYLGASSTSILPLRIIAASMSGPLCGGSLRRAKRVSQLWVALACGIDFDVGSGRVEDSSDGTR